MKTLLIIVGAILLATNIITLNEIKKLKAEKVVAEKAVVENKTTAEEAFLEGADCAFWAIQDGATVQRWDATYVRIKAAQIHTNRKADGRVYEISMKDWSY